VSSTDYEGAAAGLSLAIGKEALRFRFLLDSGQLSEADKKQSAHAVLPSLQTLRAEGYPSH